MTVIVDTPKAPYSIHPVRRVVVDGDWAIVLRWRADDAEGKTHWVDWAVVEAVISKAMNPDYDQEYPRLGTDRNEMTKDPGEGEPCVQGFVKWDGCTQFITHECHAHVDGLAHLDGLLGAVRRACVEAYACTSQDGEY